jgi:hypothetical protein
VCGRRSLAAEFDAHRPGGSVSWRPVLIGGPRCEARRSAGRLTAGGRARALPQEFLVRAQRSGGDVLPTRVHYLSSVLWLFEADGEVLHTPRRMWEQVMVRANTRASVQIPQVRPINRLAPSRSGHAVCYQGPRSTAGERCPRCGHHPRRSSRSYSARCGSLPDGPLYLSQVAIIALEQARIDLDAHLCRRQRRPLVRSLSLPVPVDSYRGAVPLREDVFDARAVR